MKIKQTLMTDCMFFRALILEGFWEGFGRPKSSIFAFFSSFFRSIFQATFWKAKKSKKIAPRSRIPFIWGRPGGMRGLRGREKERGGEGQRCRRYKKQAGYRRILGKTLKFEFSTPCTTFGGRRIASRIPPGHIE